MNVGGLLLKLQGLLAWHRSSMRILLRSLALNTTIHVSQHCVPMSREGLSLQGQGREAAQEYLEALAAQKRYQRDVWF
jgi:hypothetical protein